MRYVILIFASFMVPHVAECSDIESGARAADKFMQKLLSSDIRLEGVTIYTDTKGNVDGKSVSLDHKILRSGTSYVYQGWSSFTKGKYRETCVANNDRYRFSLSRWRGKRDWLVGGMQDSSVPPEPKDAHTDAKNEAQHFVENTTTIWLIDGTFPMSQLSALPGYSPGEFRPAGQLGRAVYEFSYDAKPRRSPETSRSTCRLEMDTNFHSLPCSVTQSVTGSTGQESWSCTREWETPADGRYSLVEITDYTYEPPAKPLHLRNRSTATVTVSLAKLPASEFRMTAFGLPEPPDFASPATPLYVWLLGAAGICFASFVAFRYLSNRRGRVSASAT